ncbi:hypothetical protein ACIQMR_14775 [Streptomyces sp. NPDC091376]|uniref:hypothetical protein n=1 Tax=Streptomyces sp. NPDC091376 TaxID=3365994 RepID=UPI00382252C4
MTARNPLDRVVPQRALNRVERQELEERIRERHAGTSTTDIETLHERAYESTSPLDAVMRDEPSDQNQDLAALRKG